MAIVSVCRYLAEMGLASDKHLGELLMEVCQSALSIVILDVFYRCVVCDPCCV